ncbi:MAG: hypothetical protein KDD51_11290 [Bdellovibrionales bacterium]|nr:hypothetical protein [Bdellovibrionales bacterium]
MRKNSTWVIPIIVFVVGLAWTEKSFAPPGPDAISNMGIDDGVENRSAGGEARFTTQGELVIDVVATCSSGNFRRPPGLATGARRYMDGGLPIEFAFQVSPSSGSPSPLYKATMLGRDFFHRDTASSLVLAEGFSTNSANTDYATVQFFPDNRAFKAFLRFTFPNRPIVSMGVTATGEYQENNDRYGWVTAAMNQQGVAVGGARDLRDISQNGSHLQASFHAVGALPQNFQFGRYYPDNCNSIKSPLMLFFDKRRPTFRGEVKFQMNDVKDLTFWVEKDAPGYFLAFDKNKDGQINNGYELFGNVEDSNGFEALREFDSNKDNLIDDQDEKFAELLLWQDKNSNGVSEKTELFSLASKRVQRISLDYDSNRFLYYGGRARARQWAYFEFTDAKGNGKKGEVIDIWFERPTSDKQFVVDYTPWVPAVGLEGPSLMDALRQPQLESRLSY